MEFSKATLGKSYCVMLQYWLYKTGLELWKKKDGMMVLTVNNFQGVMLVFLSLLMLI